jgi:hypothetical protein
VGDIANTHLLFHKPSESDLVGDLGVDGKIILKLIVEKQHVKF